MYTLLLAAPLLIVTAVLGALHQSRARAARRRNAALHTYAQREIARARRRRLTSATSPQPVKGT